MPGPNSAWFRRLSPDAQADYRRRWARSASIARTRSGRRTVGFFRTSVRGALTLAIADFAFFAPETSRLLLAAFAGAVVGLVWGLFNAGPFRSAAIAVPAYLAFWMASQDAAMMTLFTVAFAVLLVAALSVASGLVREWRAQDGDEV